MVRICIVESQSYLTFKVAPYLGLNVDRDAVNSVTRGLVGDSSFAVLPDVPPVACFLLTLAFQVVRLIALSIYGY